VPYREALAVQEALFRNRSEEHLLLLEHPHVFTHGPRSDLDHNLRCDPAAVGAELVAVSRGGDITYHGPGQLVGYPIITVANKLDAAGHVNNVEQVVIDTLAAFGVNAGRLREYPGVWVDAAGPDPRKICAIGVRLKGGRTMHGFALNVATDMAYLREHIVACGIGDLPVTSLREEGVDAELRAVVDVLARIAGQRWGGGRMERQDVAWRHRPDDLSLFSRGAGPGAAVRPDGHGEPVRLRSRLAEAGVVQGLSISTRKPDWLRPKVHHSADVLELRRTIRSLGLVTVCEDAGCPNLSECWADGTATFMVLGDRCSRACGFCLVDTRKPEPPAADEPGRVATAIDRMGVDHAVLTMVARDDLADGGMAHVAACVEAIRLVRPEITVETLISDARGDASSLATLFATRPDVLNHNVETVARLQRAVRPSAGYARSLSVLARAKAAGLATKSGLMVGLGETDGEIEGLLADLAAVGVDIVTIGQYLRPTSHHIAVDRWVEPARFDEWAALGESLGIGHVEASPLTRSSYHAKAAAAEVRVKSPVPATMAP
jgi:lipoic acid synthetase